MREDVRAHHPCRVGIGRVIEIFVEGQNLLLRRGDGARRKARVQVNAITRRLGLRDQGAPG